MDLRPSIVRILDSARETAGTGFVVTEEGLIATCTHVVELAGSGPGDTVSFVFHADREEEREASVEPAFWRQSDAEDVAILRLRGSLPDSVEPLLLGSSAGSEHHPFHTFGYSEQKPEEGTPGEGKFLQWTTENGFDVLTLRSPEVTRGFSGAPALDVSKRRVVGMVVSIAELDKSGRGGVTGYAIPMKTIEDACPNLKPSDIPPYRDLNAFTEDDAEFFFGRQQIVDQLLNKLQDEPPLLVVLGPSGSGKSSLVQAGLIAELWEGRLYGSDKWKGIVNRRYDHPLERLVEQGLEGAEEGLVSAAQAWLDQNPDKERLLLVMDQFEQLLVPEYPELQRQEFLKQLTNVLEEASGISTAVLVMRDDFYSRLAEAAPIWWEKKWLPDGFVQIPSKISHDELVAIVREPATAVGLSFEGDLVETIVNDALETASSAKSKQQGTRSTILPLLEFTLMQLWKQDHVKGLLTPESYRHIGRVTGGLRKWAQEAYRSLEEELHPLARRVLTDLVHLGDEIEGIPDTRRRQSLDDLCRNIGERARVQQVVGHLADTRLLVTSDETLSKQTSVEIIHDALLREWTQLQAWLQEDRRFLLWRQETKRRARGWKETEPELREAGRWLLRGRDLAEAEAWSEKRAAELSENEREFIQASREFQTLVVSEFEEAVRTRSKARELLVEYRRQIEEARGEGRRILIEAHKQARAYRKRSKKETRKEVYRLIQRTRKEIERERKSAMREVRSEVADMVIQASEVVIGRSIGRDEHERIERLINDALDSLEADSATSREENRTA